MIKRSVYLVSAIILMAVIAFGALKFWDKDKLSGSSISAETSSEEALETSVKKMEGLEFAQSVPEDASEATVMAMMHKMTHQKVIASEKWGIIQMDQESISKAKQLLQASDFNSKEELLEIINRWEKGKFDQVDDDHNFIWELQGGSIGRATGILTEQQEQQFIENNFSN